MSLEAIEKVSQAETKNRERKAAAEAEAKKTIADAEREGLALLQQARSDAEAEGKALQRAATRAEKISRNAEADAQALRQVAGLHLEQAAEFIVGRVVKH